MKTELNWNSPWLDHTAWILEHLEDLHLTARQALGLLVIEHFNRTGTPITHAVISSKLGITSQEAEDLFSELSDKGYLKFELDGGTLRFVTEGILDAESQAGMPLEKSLIKEFEDSFGRDLSPREMQKILDLAGQFGEDRTLIALDEAAASNARSINYIERVLVSWRTKGLTLEDLQKGIRNERQ